MVTLYVDGKPVGNWVEAEKMFAETAKTRTVEFRDDAGQVIATTIPKSELVPAWEAAITPEETARRMAGPFLTLAEYRKQAGQQ